MTPQLTVILLVCLPLLGALIAGLFGRRIGETASMGVTIGLLFVSAALSWLAFSQVIWGGWPAHFVAQVAPFIDVGAFRSSWSVRVDSLSAVMMVVVATVCA